MYALVKLLFYMIYILYMDIQYSSIYIERIYKYTSSQVYSLHEESAFERKHI